MIAVDTNVLVYAHKQGSPFHSPAKAALATLAESQSLWAIPWACLQEFYAVVTHPRIYAPPSTPSQALNQIEAWLGVPSVRLLAEAHDHFARLRTLLSSVPILGSQIYDAKIAAICLSHGVRELLTMDRDFSRYPSLNTRSLIA
jgi:toxin-antitoxin system PIN domain toxin